MRLLKTSCCKMLKVIVFSMICLLSICTVGCNKKQLNEEHTHTKVHVLKIEPTCTREGRIEYWFCSQCKKVFKDSDALYEITMEETKLPKKEHTIEEDLEKVATCEEEGLTRGKHCTTCHEIIEEQTLIDPLGHNFNFNQAVWEWEEFHSAKLVVACTNNKEHKNTYPAEITSTTIPATCTDAGKIVYTANVLIDQKEYKDKKEELLLPLEHDFDLENITWVWNEDSGAYAQISCKHDDLHILTCDAALQVNETPSTCTAGGKRITTAVVTIQGQQYKDVKEEELPEMGHSFDYESIEWTWEGYSSSYAKVTCQNDKSHQVSYEAKITTKTEQPTCMKEGKKTYRAEINVSGNSYIDEKEEVLDALNHDFDYENYTWKWREYSEATLCFECKNDPSHLDTYTAQIKTNKVLATCVAEGRVIYSANIILNDQSYTDEKEEILPIDPMNHDYDYEHLLWIWDSVVDGYIASLYIDCVCNKATVAYDANPLKIEYKPSSFETEGFKKYQAEVLINGVSYKDSKTEVLPVKQYVSSEEDFYQKIQGSSCDLTLTNDITLTSEVILEGSYAAIDLNGYTLTIPNSKFSFKATHSYIRNGYLETDLGSYAILGEDKANLLVNNVTAFGGILVKNANASIQNVDITATLESAISSRMRGTVVVENSILRKN
ncbi:MAG: hypothetical protein K2J93_04135, partial [Anaeroplasmataceae bacterium]|nr:hypothetical protein [Anaeroplasmataceae bacterium]